MAKKLDQQVRFWNFVWLYNSRKEVFYLLLLKEVGNTRRKRKERKALCHGQCFLGGSCQHAVTGRGVNRFPNILKGSDRDLKKGWPLMNCTFWIVHFVSTSKIPNVLTFLKEVFFLVQFINVSKCGCTANHSKFTLKEAFFTLDCSGFPFDFCLKILSSFCACVFRFPPVNKWILTASAAVGGLVFTAIMGRSAPP